MPLYSDFTLGKFEDGIVVLELTPPIPIGGMSLEFTLAKRIGATPLLTKSAASGFGGGVSGMTILNSGQGLLSISFQSQEMSGLDIGAYACRIARTDSGSFTVLWRGYGVLTQ